jgi:hypothetical protein
MSKRNTFSRKDIDYIFQRADYKCELCGRQVFLEGVPHHAFWKSQYHKKDVNDHWNGICICMFCHKIIHFGERQFDKDIISDIKAQITAKNFECEKSDNLKHWLDSVCKNIAKNRKK